MARDTSPQCKQCRREAEKLFLKGERCLTDKCAVERRAYPPGEHGRGRIKQSEYLLQLREKQKARRYYQVLEKQFHHYYEVASRKQGITGENLLVPPRDEARQRRVPSRLRRFASSGAPARASRALHGQRQEGRHPVVPGAPRRRRLGARQQQGRRDRARRHRPHVVGGARGCWSTTTTSPARSCALPTRDEIDTPVQEQLIVELYSK